VTDAPPPPGPATGPPPAVPPPPLPDPDAELVGPRPDGPRRVRILFELAAVIALAVIPDFFNAVAYDVPEQEAWTRRDSGWILVRSFACLLPVLALIVASREPRARFGLVVPRPVHVLVGSPVLAGAAVYVWAALVATRLLGDTTTEASLLRPSDATGFALFLVAQLANGFAEEVVCRGFLLPRIEEVTRSPAFAIGASSALFASYHVYQGAAGVIGVFGFGLLFGFVFRVTRSIVPLAVAHAFFNVVFIEG
jgi:membrane protease YdiL (CAAX protease family)